MLCNTAHAKIHDGARSSFNRMPYRRIGKRLFHCPNVCSIKTRFFLCALLKFLCAVVLGLGYGTIRKGVMPYPSSPRRMELPAVSPHKCLKLSEEYLLSYRVVIKILRKKDDHEFYDYNIILNGNVIVYIVFKRVILDHFFVKKIYDNSTKWKWKL